MNLLPTARIKILTRLYAVRVGVVSAAMLSLVLVMHSTFMVPTLVEVQSVVRARERAVATLNEYLARSEDKQVRERATQITERAGRLALGVRTHTTSSVLRQTLAVPHAGVRIAGVSFTPGVSAKMVLVGVASSREALRAYVAALGTLPYVSNVDLPITAYAKETNIEYTITLTGTFTL